MDQVKEYYGKWAEIPQPRKIKAMKLISFVCYFLFLLLLIIYAFGRTGKKTAPIIPTILFTDGTPYNLEVIRYLAQRRDVIIGMIIVASNAIAEAQLKSNIVSVSSLVSTLQSEGWKTHVPSVHGIHDASASAYLEPLEQMVATTTVNLLVIGPCTDAAFFLTQYPGRRSNVNKIFVAGGAFNTAGNANYLNSALTTAERNFYLDPSAADYIVAGSHGRPVVLLPLDGVPTWTTAAYSAIVSSPTSVSESAVEVAAGLTWYYSNVEMISRTTVGIAAAAYAVDTQVQAGVKVTIIPVRVYTSSSDARYGGSYRPQATADEKTVTVVLEVDTSTFFSHLVNVNTLALV